MLTDAVELLVRLAERYVDEEAQAAFAAGEAGTIVLRQAEQGRLRELHRHLRQYQAAQAAEGGP